LIPARWVKGGVPWFSRGRPAGEKVPVKREEARDGTSGTESEDRRKGMKTARNGSHGGGGKYLPAYRAKSSGGIPTERLAEKYGCEKEKGKEQVR